MPNSLPNFQRYNSLSVDAAEEIKLWTYFMQRKESSKVRPPTGKLDRNKDGG